MLHRGAHLAQCARSATIWAPGHTRDPYFEILGASLLTLAPVLMLLPHWGYGIFGFSPSFTHFHPFSHFLLISTHSLFSKLNYPHHGDPEKAGLM